MTSDFLNEPRAYRLIFAKLSAGDKQRIMQCTSYAKQVERMSGILLCNYAMRMHNIPQIVTYTATGKPEASGAYISIAHSANMTICGISDSNIGVDIEYVRSVNPMVARRYFTQCEQEYLSKHATRETNKQLISIWTMKEAYAKLTGQGMAAMKSFNIEFYPKPHINEYKLMEIQINGFVATCCAATDDIMYVGDATADVKRMSEI